MRLTFGLVRGRFLELWGRGLWFADIGRALGVHPNTAQRWGRLLGLAGHFDPRSEEFCRRRRRQSRALALRYGCDSLTGLYGQRRMERYRAVGYPPGVRHPTAARAVDAARRLGGLTMPDLVRAGVPHTTAHRALKELVGVGILHPAGPLACNVATRQKVTVYRLDFRAEGAGHG